MYLPALVSRGRGWWVVAICLAATSNAVPEARAQTVRSRAVVNLTFDETAGDALDSSTAGAARDNAALASGATRRSSPFSGQGGRQAVSLDAAAKQFVQIPRSADVDRPDAVAFSLFFVNLLPATDSTFHGLLGKRDDGASGITNYGINYQNSSDTLQVYLNDGTGFKVATYSLKAALGVRRPGFLTAVFSTGDAPEPDADTDKDDVLVQYYLNGRPIAPKGAVGGVVVGNAVWLLDVKTDKLVNGVPLTLGASMPALEHASAVLDEFSLFAEPLSPEDVARLFIEVAGPDAPVEVPDDTQPAPALPEVASTSLFGLQSGQTTTLVIRGANLLPDPVVLLPFPLEKQVLRPSASPGQIEVELTLAPSVSAGTYALRVQTPHGVSGAVPIAVDALPQSPIAAVGDNPLALPAAVSGTLSGQDRVRIPFTGQAGQRIVADLECRRLGAEMLPVLELKNAQGTPLSIEWGHRQYAGDARIEVRLPADGLYAIELHDLSYKAPGRNPFRLKLGDLKLVDRVLPPVATAGTRRDVRLLGPGLDPAAAATIDLQQAFPGTQQILPLADPAIIGPVPGVTASEGTEVVEEPQSAPALQTIDARFPTAPHIPLGISGQIAQPGEIDTYLLQVKPGMTLSLLAETQPFDSPLVPQISVHKQPEGTLLAISEDKPNLNYAVPANTNEVRVALRDLNGEGGAGYIYRLRVLPAGQPDFSLAVDAARLPLARDGSTVVRVDVARQGYAGPIQLQVAGAPEIALSPQQIPAGVTKAFVTLSSTSTDASPAAILRDMQILGESEGVTPPLRRAAQSPVDDRLAMVAGYRTDLAAVLTAPTGVSLELGTLPAAIFKGTEIGIPVSASAPAQGGASRALRLTLVTTETPRPAGPRAPAKGDLPMVRSVPEQVLNLSDKTGLLQVAIPGDVAEPSIDCVVRAELVSNPFSDKVLGTVYSSPFRLPVQNAITLELAENMLVMTGDTASKFQGTIKRSPGFAEQVEVALLNLPASYTAPKVTLPPDQSQFEVVITAPKVTAEVNVANVVLRVTGPTGNLLQADMPLKAKVVPGT